MSKKLSKAQRIAQDRIIEHVVWWWGADGIDGTGSIPFGSLVGEHTEEECPDDDVTFNEVIADYVGTGDKYQD